MLVHTIAHGDCTDTEESLHWKLTGRKIPWRTGGESNLRQRRAGPTLYQLSYIPILYHFSSQIKGCCTDTDSSAFRLKGGGEGVEIKVTALSDFTSSCFCLRVCFCVLLWFILLVSDWSYIFLHFFFIFFYSNFITGWVRVGKDWANAVLYKRSVTFVLYRVLSWVKVCR